MSEVDRSATSPTAPLQPGGPTPVHRGDREGAACETDVSHRVVRKPESANQQETAEGASYGATYRRGRTSWVSSTGGLARSRSGGVVLDVEIGVKQPGYPPLCPRHRMAVAPTRCPATVHPSSRSSTPGIGGTDAGEELPREGVRTAGDVQRAMRCSSARARAFSTAPGHEESLHRGDRAPRPGPRLPTLEAPPLVLLALPRAPRAG
jgi:hypothetical protein